ncbi:hypothetical protein CBL_14381 [Carabus blaptoides fortunei]
MVERFRDDVVPYITIRRGNRILLPATSPITSLVPAAPSAATPLRRDAGDMYTSEISAYKRSYGAAERRLPQRETPSQVAVCLTMPFKERYVCQVCVVFPAPLTSAA